MPEDKLHPKRSKVYTVKTLDRVPAHCIFLQADGSVGFFIQPRDEWPEVLELLVRVRVRVRVTLTLTLTLTRSSSSRRSSPR